VYIFTASGCDRRKGKVRNARLRPYWQPPMLLR
jgi:hypothetical protein